MERVGESRGDETWIADGRLEPPEASAHGGHVRLGPYDPSDPTSVEAKRFFERWLADERFRALLETDPDAAAAVAKINVDASDLRVIWDRDYQAELQPNDLTATLAVLPAPSLRFLEWVQANQVYRDRLKVESVPVDPRFAAWRRRQIARSATIFREAYDRNTPHITFAIELSRGCSVGCWFCGVSAPAFEDVLRHSDDNARLFDAVLGTLTDHVGTRAASHGFLYWATDPFDNPDYERFCLRFKSACGVFPLTTTALPLRDVSRTRAFIDFAERHGAGKIRFSVATLKQFDDLHATFSASELKIVDILPFNKGSLLQPSASGRARTRERRPTPDVASLIAGHKRDETISCVSGFLVNLPARTIKLISPCNSSDEWPLGYIVYEEARFASAEEFSDIVEGMIRRNMMQKVPREVPVRFRRDLRYEPHDDGFAVRAIAGSHTFSGNLLLRDVADDVSRGTKTPHEIAVDFAATYPIDASVPLGWLDEFFEAGLIDDLPVPA